MSETTDYSSKQQLIGDFFRMIENALETFINQDKYSNLNMIDAPIAIWNACLQYIGKTVFVIHNSNGRNTNKVKPDDLETLSALLEYYVYLCNSYNKVPSLLGYSYFLGYSYNTIYDMRNGLYYNHKAGHDIQYVNVPEEITRKRSQLLKSINKLHETILIERLSNNNNPVAMIAAGNVVHNWDNRRAETNQDAQQIESNAISAKYLLSDTQNAENRQIVSETDTIPDFTDNDLQ